MGQILSIVQGNNFGTAISIHAVDAEGHEIQDFSLEGSTDIRVWYLFAGKETEVEAWTMEDGKILIVWPKDITLGSYDIFIEGVFEATAWRNAMKSQFRIVKYNYEAYIPDDVIVLNGIYQLSAEMAILTRISGGGGIPSSTTPLMDGEAQVGTENAYARGDHRHPSDTNKQDVIADLDAIRSGAQKGATAYQKPTNGIPSTDIASGVIPDVSNFITKSVNDLTYYYLKTETYTMAEVNNLIGAIQQFHYEIAASTSAVTNPQSNVLYLIGPTGSGADKYEEYVYTNSTWTKIGDTSIDLSGYVTTTYLNTALAGYQTKIDSSHKLDYSLIDNTPTIPSVVDSLSSASTTAALSAHQGKVLNEGKQDKIDNSHKLSADLVDDTSTTNKFVTASDKAIWSGKQDALVSGTNIKTINNESILGSGNITIQGGSSGIPIVNHGTSDTTYSVTPNTLHIWGTVASLTLTLATPTDNTIVNEYMIEFTSGSTATTLSLPASVEWGNRDPLTGQTEPLVVVADATYQISIVNNIGLWTAIANS